MGSQGFDKTKAIWLVKVASCDSSSIELAIHTTDDVQVSKVRAEKQFWLARWLQLCQKLYQFLWLHPDSPPYGASCVHVSFRTSKCGQTALFCCSMMSCPASSDWCLCLHVLKHFSHITSSSAPCRAIKGITSSSAPCLVIKYHVALIIRSVPHD